MDIMEELNYMREENAWRKYEETEYLYRVDALITPGEFTEEGFTSQHVYAEGRRKGFSVFLDPEWAGHIAQDLGLYDGFLLHRIPKSAIPHGAIIWDNCAEDYASVSLICLVDYVPPQQIEMVDVYKFTGND